MSASASKSSNSTTTVNEDNRITTGQGNILALTDNTLTVEEGGNINIVENDPAAAYRAIEAIENTSKNLVSAVLDGATQLAEGSNKVAAQVADSQKSFVEVASGNKAVTYAVAIVGGVAVLFALPMIVKSLSKK